MYAATIFKQFSKTFVLYRWISNAHAHEHNVLKGFFKAPFFIVKVFIFFKKKLTVKFISFMKAMKTDEIFTVDLTFTTTSQIDI